jgi:Ca2+-binding RTX toxin-like protein
MPNITVEQFRTTELDPNIDYTLKDTGANLATLTAEELATVSSLGVNKIDATDNLLTLSAAQYLALEPFLHTGDHSTDLTGGDNITLADTAANLGAMTPDQWAGLDNNHIDHVAPTDGALAISWAQYVAMNHELIKNVDSLTLLDTRANIEAMTVKQLADLDNRGFDAIDVIENLVHLTKAQYEAIHSSVALTDADRIWIDVDGDYTLADNVDNLKLLGNGDWNGTGNAFDNILRGNSGDNTLDGAGGSDRLLGGRGDDTYIVDGGDVVMELADQGNDTVHSSGSYRLTDNVENLVLTGDGDFRGAGNAGDNSITGNDGDNRIVGNDGTDTLTGGLGADLFAFDNGDSDANILLADHIEDFSQTDGDIIILRQMDANTNLDGNQAFTFIGTEGFSGTAGELRIQTDGPGNYSVRGDVDGDSNADFVIVVHAEAILTSTDFIL